MNKLNTNNFQISVYDGVITFKNKNTTIGFIRFNQKGEIEYIYVAPLFRGQGVAKKLLKLTKKRVGKELIPQQPISPLGKKLFNIV
jgi:ribosomal protein S18 acetylase RimI-like enzyme